MSEGKPLVEDENSTLDKIIKYFPHFAISITVLMFAIYFIRFHGGLGDHNAFGTFGDFFGGILNPMLTFFTILLLLRQLSYQQNELNVTLDELRKTSEIHEENKNITLANQIYEKTQSKFHLLLENKESAKNLVVIKKYISSTDEVKYLRLKDVTSFRFGRNNFRALGTIDEHTEFFIVEILTYFADNDSLGDLFEAYVDHDVPTIYYLEEFRGYLMDVRCTLKFIEHVGVEKLIGKNKNSFRRYLYFRINTLHGKLSKVESKLYSENPQT